MSNDLVHDHLVSNRGSEPTVTTIECSVGSPWKMENILRLGLTSNSLIPMPKSGKFSSASSENDNSKLSKTEQNKLRLILQYGSDSTDHSAGVDCTDDADKEKKVSHGTRIPVNSFGSRNQRFEMNKAREDNEEKDAKERSVPCFGSGSKNGVPFGVFGNEPARCTALGLTRPCGSEAPPSTHPVATPAPQLPQSHSRTQTRCARGNVARYQRVDCTNAVPAPTLTSKVNKEDVMEPELKEKDEHKSSTPSPELLVSRVKSYNEDGSSEDEGGGPSTCSRTQRLSSLYHGTWPVERGLWNSQQTGLVNQQSTSTTGQNDIASVMSFSSVSMGDRCPPGSQGIQGQRRLGAKVDVVYSLLGMLGGAEGREDMSATLLSMSSSTDSCLAMRQSGCLPLLVQLIHAPGQDPETRERASQAIHNIVHSRGDERPGRREARVLRLLEQLRDYCQTLRTTLEAGQPLDDFDRHPGPTIAALMKLSFDEAHRHAMCQLGGLHAVAELIEMDHAAHGSECDDQNCVTLRRYAGMALTNLTFGDGNNKALLCSFREFMKALVAQLRSPSDDLRQVTASVLRNLSWRADSSSKQTLREVGAVMGLTMAAMEGRKESTLKSILSALWNLSAHCSTNKIDICAVEGALAFLVDMLSYKAPSKTLAIVENAGGILRNVSSHVAVREDYRSILRERGCLQVLLRQLRSPSLTVVSNACGALWNLSARCPQDQRMLWDLGAVPMLRSLVHSKHKMISMGSSAALKNLLGARPGSSNLVHLDSTARGLGLPTLPTLVARRQRALEQEIDQNLAETCDNIEPSTSPTNKEDKFGFKVERRFAELDSRAGNHSYQMQNSQPGPSSMRFNSVARSESRESVRSITSTHSDTIFERVNRHVLNGVSPTESQVKQQSSSLHAATGFNTGISTDGVTKGSNSDRKYVLRYKNAMPERHRPSTDLSFNEATDLRCTTSTMSWASAADQEAACSQMLLHSSIENSLSSELNSRPLMPNRDEIKSQYREENKGVASFSNGETTGAIKRDIGSRFNARGVDQDDEKQHSGYFAESEEENESGDRTQSKSRSLKRETKYSSYRTDDASNSSSSTSSFGNATAIEKSSNEIQGINYNSKVEVRNDICTLDRVSDDDTSLKFPHRQQETSLTLPQYDSLGLPSFTSLESESVDSSTAKASSISDQPGPCEAKHNTFFEDAQPSSLTIDDEPKIAHDSRLKERGDIEEEIVEPLNLNIGSILEDVEEDNEANELEEMQNARHSIQPFRRSSLQKSAQPLSNLARYQTSSALNQVDVAGLMSLTTETSSYGESAQDADEILGDIIDSDQILETLDSPVSITEHERDLESMDEFSNVLSQDGRIEEEKIRQDSTTSAGFSPILENSEIDSHPEEDHCDGEKASADKTSAPIIVSASSQSPVATDCLVPDESRPVLQEENIIEAQNLLSRIQSVLASHGSDDLGDKHRVQPNEIEETGSTTLFDFSLNSENCVDGRGDAAEKVALDKIDDDTENTNASEEENLSDEVTSPTIDPLFSAVERAAKNKIDRSKNREETDEEYRRQRDPDAMIASLDRLTATLVQQTEAMRERESSAMKQSVVSDTWNEDSPNDVSFPSISVSAPLIASFKSDNQEEQTFHFPENFDDAMNEIQGTMTDSKIIEREANKLAEAVNARVAEFDFEAMTSMDLEAIKPPSMMGSLVSLTTSLIGPIDNCENSVGRERCHSTSLPPTQFQKQITTEYRNSRKKSLPAGVMAKRALSQYQNHTGSLENLLNENSAASISHLDNVKPPSMMDELLDAMDMENSMLSVASITSEIADLKDQDSHSLTASDPVFDLLKPVANILSMTCMRYAESMQVSGNNSLSECLENINPPSLFNEVSEMDESTIEPTSDTFCSDTLCIDQELHTEEISRGNRGSSIDRIEECDNDTDDAATPIPSEYCVSSSAESTPKKRHKNHLTPKQKRQLAKERYKTYTIAAEMVKKEEEERRKHENEESGIGKYTGGKCSPFSKLTPKQRRQEDRARFQTQVLNNPFPVLGAYNPPKPETASADIPEADEGTGAIVKSGIPKFRKFSGGKTVKQKRAENKERFRTRTLDDEEAQEASKDVELLTSGTKFASSESSIETTMHITSVEMETMLGKNSNVVLNVLGQGNSRGEDVLIDCETLSLVSNDSEAEHNLRMRLANGLSKRLGAKPHLPEPTTQYYSARFTEEKQLSSTKNLESPAQDEPRESSDSENGEESNSANEQSQIPKRPRIVKPGAMSRDASVDSNATDKSEPGSPKVVIRGRRKALYSNPTSRKSTPQISPAKISSGTLGSGIPIGRSNTSPLVRGTRATTLRQTHNPSFATKSPQKSIGSKIASPATGVVERRAKGSAAVASNRTSIPQRGTVSNYSKSTKRHTTPSSASTPQYGIKDEKKEPTIKPLERQGTFTKEEPEVENAPTVPPPCSPSKSKIAKPIKTSPSRIQTPSSAKSKPMTKQLQTPQPKLKDQTKTSSPTSVYQRRSLIGSPIKNSPSTQSLQSNESGRGAKRTNTLGQRSNSNSSIVSNSSTGVPTGRRTTKEATSKIASLWKRVEESKTKQRFEKNDTRHWITPSACPVEAGSPVVTSKPPAFRLIRSSTFEGVPKDVPAGKLKSEVGKRQARVTDAQNVGPKYRNSCDLSGVSIAEAPCQIPMKYQVGETVILRKKDNEDEIDPTKRISRLGSFIRADPPEADASNTQNQTNVNAVRAAPASAIVSPFNYNPKQTSPVKASISEIDGKLDIAECQMEITTSSMRVTTV